MILLNIATSTRPYALAILWSGAVLGLSLVLHPEVDLAVLPLFLAAVTLSAWGGGWGPGVVATILSSAASNYFFMPPVGSIVLHANLVHLGEFVLSGLVITGLTSALRSSLGRTKAAHLEARREIARRKEIEEELRRFSSGLEARVLERTVELQATVRELDAFAYTVAHDLRAPLRGMTGFGELLLQDYAPSLDSTAQDYTRRVVCSAKRMDQLIRDLLAYNSLSRDEVHLRSVNLADAVHGVMEEMSEEMRAREADVVVDVSSGRLLADGGLLSLVFRNLLSNALKFTATGVRPRVQVRSEDREDVVRVWVEDNGIGIAPAFHERIFRVFERLNPADTDAGGGIGLASVRRAMERMGGASGVESEEGQGSRFWIEVRKPSTKTAPGV